MDLIANDLSRFGQDISDYQSARVNLDKNFEMLTARIRELSTIWEGEARDQFMEMPSMRLF